MVWLVDCTHYSKSIDPQLATIRNDYLRIKRYKRDSIIGECATPGKRIYALGLLRIATILHRNGVDVKYIDCEDLIAVLGSVAPFPEVVAFSCVCPTVDICADLAKKIKEISPSTRIVLGGVHVNLCYSETARRYQIFDDFSVGYETEAAEKIIQQHLDPVKNVYADYSLLPYPLKEYSINTFTVSGCPFKCDYCVDGKAQTVFASKDGQVSTMKSLLPPKTMIHFFDSVLGHSRLGAESICKTIETIGHDFILSCDMRADLLTPSLIKSLQRAGFVELRMGIESADQRLLDRNNRTLKVEGFIDRMKMIRDNSSIYITLYSIVGLPGTTIKSQEMTMDYFHQLLVDKYADEIKNTQYVPYPMEGVDYAKRGVFITTDDWSKYDRQSFPVYQTEECSSKQLWDLYLKTAKGINDSWLQSCGFSDYNQIPNVGNNYGEYMEIRANGDQNNS